MALYDDAKIMFLASAAAGLETKDASKVYNVKPDGSLGSELIINGTFDSDSDWTKGTGFSISGGVASCDGSQSSTTNLHNAAGNGLVNGKTYRVEYTITSYTAGIVRVKAGNTGYGTDRSAAGTYVEHLVASGTPFTFPTVQFNAESDFVGSIDNVSCKEMDVADFTISRDANLDATRVGPTGLIEKGRENKFLYSTNFSKDIGTWGHAGLSSVQGIHNSLGQEGYDGTNNATYMRSETNTGVHRVQVNTQAGVSVNSQVVQTISIHAKPLGYTFLGIGTQSGNQEAYFDLANGTVGTTESDVIEAKITPAGNGYFRCSMTVNADIAITQINFNIALEDNNHSFTGDPNRGGTNNGGIFIQDAQWELGLVPTEIIFSNGSAGTAGIKEDEPRFDYPLSGGAPALLVEPLRKNEVPNSEGIVEHTNDVTLTVNYGIAPDGTKSSLKVAKDGADANDRIQPISNDNVTLTNSENYSISAFVKNIDCTGVTTLACRTDAGSNELFRQGFQWTGTSLALTSTGASGTRTGAFVESYGNDWWRIGFTFTANSTAGDFELDIDRANGTATTSIETWGWQLEEGSNSANPTSYIPCHGTAATRSADVLPEITHGITLGTAVTVLLEARVFGGGGQISILQLRVDDQNRFLFFATNSSVGSTHDINVQHRESDTNVAIQKTGLTRGDIFKCIGRVDGTTFNVFVNGVKLGTTGTVVAADIYDKISLIRNGTTTNQSGHKTKSVVVWDSALTDQQCIDLTTL